ncbi:hypothetical protein ACXJJ3_32750 [Kribbella sp. WER1]
MANYITFEGFRMDARTRDMLIELRRITTAPVVLTQGGFNKGGVAASAGTHDGGGALDIRARNLTDTQIREVVLRARQVGFAAWHRTPAQGKWVEHIHMIAVGCPSLSAGAKKQVTAYKNDRNGLANNGKDDGPRLYAGNTWESYKASIAKQGGNSAQAPRGATVHRFYIQYGAYGGYFHTGQKTALDECRLFVRWCGRLGVASERDMRVWETFIRQNDWRSAGLQLTGIIKNLQRRYRLHVDGVFGPQTASIMQHDNYNVVA